MPDHTLNNTITGPENLDAIEGVSHSGRGVTGSSDSNYGMRAVSTTSAGIRGSSVDGYRLWSTSRQRNIGRDSRKLCRRARC